MKRRCMAALCAVSVLLCAGCTEEETYTADDLEEAYERGMDEVINNPEKYISFDEAAAEGYADGYNDGWHDCKNGVPLENPVIAEFERTQGK